MRPTNKPYQFEVYDMLQILGATEWIDYMEIRDLHDARVAEGRVRNGRGSLAFDQYRIVRGGEKRVICS